GAEPVDRVRFVQVHSVDEDLTGDNLDAIARHADAALDEIRIALFRQGRAEHDDLLTLRVAPQGNVPIGERNAGIVAESADDQMTAHQDGGFHRAPGNS